MIKEEVINGLEEAMDEILEKDMLSSRNALNIILALIYLVEKENNK